MRCVRPDFLAAVPGRHSLFYWGPPNLKLALSFNVFVFSLLTLPGLVDQSSFCVVLCALILSWTFPFNRMQSCCTFFKQCSHNAHAKTDKHQKKELTSQSLACWLPSSPLGVLGILRPCQSLYLKKVGVTLNLNQSCVPAEDHTEPRFLKRLLLIESTSRSDCIGSTPCISFTASTWQLGNSLINLTFGP